MNAPTDKLRMYPSGNHVDPLDPDPDLIEIEDIAWHLAHEARFGGGTPFHYSVARHSIYVMKQIPDDLTVDVKLQALLHDAPEAYLKDIPRPVKERLHDYQALEATMWEAICTRFDLPGIALFRPVIRADEKILKVEKSAFFGARKKWQQWERPSNQQVRRMFLYYYHQLSGRFRPSGEANETTSANIQ